MVVIENLSKEFKGKKIFEEADLSVSKGEICGIVGRNGIGKSVLLKMIAGLMYPTGGTIKVDGVPLVKGSFPRDVGVVLDNIGFLKEYSGYKNLKIIASILNRISDDRIRECMQLVGLSPEDKTKVRKYSLGMRQKLSIAQAIMEHPKLLLLDEPFNGLDAESEENIKKRLLQINKEENTTILIISHNRDELMNLSDRLVKIENKKILLQ